METEPYPIPCSASAQNDALPARTLYTDLRLIMLAIQLFILVYVLLPLFE